MHFRTPTEKEKQTNNTKNTPIAENAWRLVGHKITIDQQKNKNAASVKRLGITLNCAGQKPM